MTRSSEWRKRVGGGSSARMKRNVRGNVRRLPRTILSEAAIINISIIIIAESAVTLCVAANCVPELVMVRVLHVESERFLL